MTDNNEMLASKPTTPQLIEALRKLAPSASRDMGIELLVSGRLNADSSFADLAQAIKEYCEAIAPQHARQSQLSGS